jgi:hypothetical protein
MWSTCDDLNDLRLNDEIIWDMIFDYDNVGFGQDCSWWHPNTSPTEVFPYRLFTLRDQDFQHQSKVHAVAQAEQGSLTQDGKFGQQLVCLEENA